MSDMPEIITKRRRSKTPGVYLALTDARDRSKRDHITIKGLSIGEVTRMIERAVADYSTRYQTDAGRSGVGDSSTPPTHETPEGAAGHSSDEAA